MKTWIIYIWNTTGKTELTKCDTTKNVAISKRYIFSEKAQTLKTTFHNFVFNIETGWATRLVSLCYKLEILMYVCMHAFFFFFFFYARLTFPDMKHLFRAPKSAIFELQLCPSNHKTFRGSWNLVIVTLGDSSTRGTQKFCGKVCHGILKQY